MLNLIMVLFGLRTIIWRFPVVIAILVKSRITISIESAFCMSVGNTLLVLVCSLP